MVTRAFSVRLFWSMVLLTTLISMPVIAQSEIKFGSVESKAVKTLSNVNPTSHAANGIQISIDAPDGMVFVIVDMKLDISWDEETQNYRINSRDITATDAAGANYKQSGKNSAGYVSNSGAGISINRPYQFKDNPQIISKYNFSPIFIVPADTKELTVKINELTSVKVPVNEAEATYNMSRIPSVKILSIKDAPELKSRMFIASGSVTSDAKTDVSMKVVNVQFNPKEGNSELGSFMASSRWLTIQYEVDGKKYVASTKGALSSGQYTTIRSVSSRQQDNGKYNAVNLEVLFSLPANATNKKLLYLNNVVADM